MSIVIREMTTQDYDEVLTLWRTSEGVGLSDADLEEGVAHFLDRNPGLSFVARDGEHLVGAVLCGHDGRRGYIHHRSAVSPSSRSGRGSRRSLAVSKSHRRQGLGRALVGRCLSALRRAGIGKCHIFVFADNQDIITFWKNIGWTERVELVMMSRYIQ